MSRNRVVIPLPLRLEAGHVVPWRVFVADPAWRFGDRGSRIAPDQRKKRQGRKGYRTLTVEQIAAIPVREVADQDALLFLWTTSAHLVDGSATAVCRAWGFEPKTTIVWVKARWADVPFRLVRWLAGALRGEGTALPVLERARRWAHTFAREVQALTFQIGMGHYTRGAHELVVVAARGRATRLVKDHGVPSVIVAPRGKHSAKPEAFRDLVDRLTGGAPVLELFARSSRPGWTAWGDQAPTPPPVCATNSVENVVGSVCNPSTGEEPTISSTGLSHHLSTTVSSVESIG